MKKILIVDDQPEVRELVDVTLRIGEYTIWQAANGDQALTVAHVQQDQIRMFCVGNR